MNQSYFFHCAWYLQTESVTLSLQKTRVTAMLVELRRVSGVTVYAEARHVAEYLVGVIEHRFYDLLHDLERPALIASWLDPRTMRSLVNLQPGTEIPTQATLRMLYTSTASQKCVLDTLAEDLPDECSGEDWSGSSPLKTELGIYVKMVVAGKFDLSSHADVLAQLCSPLCSGLPLLTKLARTYLVSRPSVSEADCAFSIGGQISSALRRRIAHDLHQALTCLAHDARGKAGEAVRRRRKPVPADCVRRAELMISGMGRKAACAAVKVPLAGTAVAAVAVPGGPTAGAAGGVAQAVAGIAGGGLPVIDLDDDDDDDSDDEGDLALALLDHGVPYDPLRGFDFHAAVLAVEVAAGAVDRDDDAEAVQATSVEDHPSAALLAVLHDDSVAGRRRSTRAMTAQVAANVAAAAEAAALPAPAHARKARAAI